MMKKPWMWGVLAAALLLPAVGYAAKVMSAPESCPVGCTDCPFKK